MEHAEHTPDVPALWNDLARQARALAANGTEMDTAAGLREIVFEVYNAAKFDRPGGEGVDGADGPEREGIGHVHDAAEDHYHRTLRRIHGTHGQ